MARSIINRFIGLFQYAFAELGADVSLARIEEFAILIHRSMDSGRRVYHTSSHALMVSESMGPHQTLAGLFHDLVYYQIDEGVPEPTREMVYQFVEQGDGQVSIKAEIDVEDPMFNLCLDVFDFHPGQVLSPFAGLNEFLSAVIAVKQLEPHLALSDLLTVAACIEATIPFRGINPEGQSSFEQLEDRLRIVNQTYDIALTDPEIEDIVRRALVMANKDVGGFAVPSLAEFLSDTWTLLPETNAIMWSVGAYSIQDYRRALMKMEVFLSILDPQAVFHSYKDVPETEDFETLGRLAEKNMRLAREYLGAKLLSITILEALAVSTGGDAPISMFLGDIVAPAGDDLDELIGGHPPSDSESKELHYDEELLSTLETGRSSDSPFDLTTSPVSALVYKALGPDKVQDSLVYAREMFIDELSPADFLDHIDPQVLRVLINACSEVAITRRDALLELEAALPQ